MAAEKKVEHFDVVVIGSGGGTKISTPASKLGMRACIIEKGYDVFGTHKVGLGGTCLNRGCIPSKMLIQVGFVAETIRFANHWEIQKPAEPIIDWEKMIERVNAEVDKDSNSIVPAYAKNPNLMYVDKAVRFIGERRLLVPETGLEITGDKIFIAAGARPAEPPIPGLKGTPYLTSTEALRNMRKPASLGIIGGGYIASEMAFFYGACGVPITMFVRSKMISFEDEEVIDEFTGIFSKRFPCVFGGSLDRVEYTEGVGFRVHHTPKDGPATTYDFEQLLVATGITPNSDTLDLEKAGINVNEQGFIQVDGFLRTSAPGVWALGDIIGKYAFRHAVNWEGDYLLETLFRAKEGADQPVDYTGMPHAIFTHPQIAGVGERESDLVKRGAQYVKGRVNYKNSAMGQALRSDHGFVKLLIERGTRKILGCHIIGDEASILVHEVIPLMRLGGRLDDLLMTIHIHPAMSELVRNAARDARDKLVALNEEMPDILRIK